MVEKILFDLLAFTMFILMFFNLIRKNDTNYLYIIAIQFIGIVLGFIELIFAIHFGIIVKMLMYIISIVLPMIILIVEYKAKLNFTEIFNSLLSDIFHLFKKYDKEEQCLLELMNKYPDSILGHKKLGKLYETKNENDKALGEYEAILDSVTDKEKIYTKIGKLYKDSGKEKEAKLILAEALKENPKSYEASISLAEILYDEGEYKDAVQIYLSAIQYKPLDYNLYYYLGMTYTMLNDFQKAKENYEKAAQINSELYHAKYNLGQLSLIYGDLDEAKMYFEQCLNYRDIEEDAYYYLAIISITKGELEKAINYANIAIENDYKIYEKILSNNMFVAIIDKIKKPESQEILKETKLSENEIKVDKHLEETENLVGKLNNNDIQMIENVMKTRQIEKHEEDKEEKERNE